MVKPLGFSGSVLERFPYYKNGTGIDVSKNKQYAQNLQNGCAGMTSLNPYNSYNRPYPGQEASFGGSYLGRFPSNSFQFISLAGTAMAGAAVIMTLLNKGKVSPEILKLIEKQKNDNQVLNVIMSKLSELSQKTDIQEKLPQKVKVISDTLTGKITYSEEELDKPILNKIRMEARKRIERHDIPRLENPTVWIPTSETVNTVKEGGLAEVPVQIADTLNNKVLNGGVKGEGIVLSGLYVHNGAKTLSGMKAFITELGNGKAFYKVGNNKDGLLLQKLCELEIPVHENGILTFEKTKIYTTKVNNTRYILFSNKRMDITDGKDAAKISPYTSNGNSNEQERFAFFSKAVHEFALHLKKNEENGKLMLTDGSLVSRSEFDGKIDAIKPPDAMIANDWQAGPCVALFRYMTQIKAKMNVISEEAAEKLSNIPIVYVGHNMAYQGWVNDKYAQDKILSLLFEKYMKSLRTVTISHPQFDNHKLNNTLYTGESVNFAQMGCTLADMVKPVSKNYAEQVATSGEFSRDLPELLRLRKNQGTMIGTVNGNDKANLIPTEPLISKLNNTLKLKEITGIELKPYTAEDADQIKPENSKVLNRYLKKYVADLKAKSVNSKDPPLISPEYTDISDITDKTPIYVMIGRMDPQKGFDINMKAIKKLYEQLTKDNKEKPVFIMAGKPSPPVNKGDKDMLEDILKPKKAEMKEMGNRIVIMPGFVTDELKEILQVGGQYFDIPSWFEPCGLVQMEAMAKGTIPVASRTGGLVDTIKHGVDGFLSKEILPEMTDANLQKNAASFAEALKQSYDLFVNDSGKYYQMVKNAMNNDFSWIIDKNPADRKGSFWEYMDALNIAV